MALDKLKRISLAEYVTIGVSTAAIISLFSYICLFLAQKEIYPEMGDVIGKLVIGSFAPFLFGGWREKSERLVITDYLLIGIIALMVCLIANYQLLNWLDRPNPHQLVSTIDTILITAFAGTNFRKRNKPHANPDNRDEG